MLPISSIVRSLTSSDSMRQKIDALNDSGYAAHLNQSASGSQTENKEQTMNFTEELVSWYLRFNGFFPIDNFVLHAIRCQFGKGSFDKHNADSDVIAIRPRSVMEIINGHPLKWAEEFGTERWGIGALEGPWPRNVAILVEVKFRKVFDKDALAAVEKSFCDCRVIPALKRCGLNPAEMALVPGKPFYENKEKDWYFAKCIALDHEDQFSKLSKSI